MLDAIYVAAGGMTSFATGLLNISNNVANINSIGYKGTGLQFSDLMFNYGSTSGGTGGAANGPLNFGSGVTVSQPYTIFTQGTINQTGGSSDLAINGNGFFILRQNGSTSYTRDGQLSFDGQGYLIETLSKARVQGLAPNGSLVDINTGALSVSPAKATSKVELTGNLSINVTGGTATLSQLTVYDAAGTAHNLSVVFTMGTDPTQRSWTVQVQDSAGNPVGASGQVQFQPDGSPQTGANTFSFTMPGAGGKPQTVELDFGAPGSFTGVTSFSGGTTATIAVASQDGYAAGSLTTTTFNADGTITLQYSNGQSNNTSLRLALADFASPQELTRTTNNAFTNVAGVPVTIGTAGKAGFGQIQSGSLEASNVDLAQSFSDLIVIERGYQSCSEAVGAANEMAQQLLDVVHRR